jgi:hypothetical protein
LGVFYPHSCHVVFCKEKVKVSPKGGTKISSLDARASEKWARSFVRGVALAKAARQEILAWKSERGFDPTQAGLISMESWLILFILHCRAW